MGKKIKVEFDQHGNVRYVTEGFVGTQCQEASAYIENALRGTKGKDDPTGEMYAPAGGVDATLSQRF